MPNGFGGPIQEELAFCKLPSNETESDCMVMLPAGPWPRERVTHQQRYSHSVTHNTHTHTLTRAH